MSVPSHSGGGGIGRGGGAMKICRITIHRIAVLSKIRSVEYPFLMKIHSAELMIRRINLI